MSRRGTIVLRRRGIRMVRISTASRRMPTRTPIRAMALLVSAAALIFALVLMRQGGRNLTPDAQAAELGEAPRFVGSETCARCHSSEAKLWAASQHNHAMDHATDRTVLGDFGNASFDYNGVHSR